MYIYMYVRIEAHTYRKRKRQAIRGRVDREPLGVRDLNSLAAISESFDVPSKGRAVRKPTWKWLLVPSRPVPSCRSLLLTHRRSKVHTHASQGYDVVEAARRITFIPDPRARVCVEADRIDSPRPLPRSRGDPLKALSHLTRGHRSTKLFRRCRPLRGKQKLGGTYASSPDRSASPDIPETLSSSRTL